MILDEYVKVEWKTRSRKQYEDLGYKFTNYGDIFYVKIEDMPKGSHYKINYKCDNCELSAPAAKTNRQARENWNKLVSK